jgi:LuxR family transcriptional regulator, maltose regulon positive regulatory protein
VAALGDRPKIWVAGLQLAALSLRATPTSPPSWWGSPAATATSWTTWPRRCWTASTHLREFLLETSILERLSGPLCAAVTGRSDSQQLLEQVERANLFLMPLGEVRGWWGYHQLFADLLR